VTSDETAPAPHISVVVPVYNTGAHLEDLVRSLAAQTMPQEEFEVIFIDDGSTDDTPARLDQLAAERPNVRVVHEPHSGWPGGPRNVGIDLARGEYIFFSDDDDWFGTEALERLYAFAVRTGAEIVLPRAVGHGRGVPRVAVERTIERATLRNAPLIDSLKVHKLFRTEFLRRHGLRFPEGHRRLEDQVFVVEAYLLADRISVLADYDYYHHVRRSGHTHLTAQPVDWNKYYGDLGFVLDAVERHTRPGPFRDRLLRRFLRAEMLGRLDGRSFLAHSEERRHVIFTAVRRLLLDRFPPTVDDLLPGHLRVLASLVRDGDEAGAVRLAEWTSTVAAQTLVERVALDGDALAVQWRAPASGSLARSAAAPAEGLVARRRDDGRLVDLGPPEQVPIDPSDPTVVRYRTSICLRPGGDQQLGEGIWDIYVRYRVLEWTMEERLARRRGGARTAVSALLGPPPTAVVAYWTPHDRLSVHVDPSLAAVAAAFTPQTAETALPAADPRVALSLAVPQPIGGHLVLTPPHEATPVRLPAVVEAGPDGASLAIAQRSVAKLPRTGRWRVALVLDGAPPVPMRVDLVRADGGTTLVASGAPPDKRRTTRHDVRRIARRVHGVLRRHGAVRLRRALLRRRGKG
jgi:glycosyltransferase involved in cell wall biosynthesis